MTERIKIIDDFLQKWKIKAIEYYTNLRKEQKIQRNKQYQINKENLKELEKYIFKEHKYIQKYTDLEIENILKEIKNNTISGQFKHNIQVSINHNKYKNWESKHTQAELVVIQKGYNKKELEKIIDFEVERKYNSLINRIKKKCGNIIDVKTLYIADNGELNGTIKGVLKTVNINTIYAGGYNVQCLHYRVLIKDIKE